MNIIMDRASKVFEYFYSQALPEFGPENAKKLAQIPADYVYNQLISRGTDCYINSECCLEYCNEVLDSDFVKLDPLIKKMAYEKAYGVSVGNISQSEINIRLKAKRKVNKLYSESIRRFRTEREDDLSSLMSGISLKRKSTSDFDLDFKKLKLQ
jgi:hypothetical protein